MVRPIVITVYVEEEPMDIEDEALADSEEAVRETLEEYGYTLQR
jgi:hypothetical protein